MADTKLADLTALPTPATTDLVYVVADPGGTPVDRKATIAAVLALGGGGAPFLSVATPNITVTGTATETDVFTVSVPGGTLGTARALRLTLIGRKLKNGGGPDSGMVMKVYYGATAILTVLPTQVDADSATAFPTALTAWIYATGATGTQGAYALLINPKWGGDQRLFPVTASGTAAIDSTAAQTLRVTWTQAATTAHSYTSDFALVEAL